MTNDDDDRKHDHQHGTGSEGQGSSGSALPFEPSKDDDSPVGDTDQHSKVDHSKDPAKDIKPGNAAND